MTTQNWPDPKRPGVPMFPDYYGEHILKELITGKEVPTCWDANCPRSPGWDISALNSQTPETVALYFTYVRCEAIKLTPTQINEMLAAERQWCAKTCEAEQIPDFSMPEQWYNNGCKHSARAIRNLGDAT